MLGETARLTSLVIVSATSAWLRPSTSTTCRTHRVQPAMSPFCALRRVVAHLDLDAEPVPSRSARPRARNDRSSVSPPDQNSRLSRMTSGRCEGRRRLQRVVLGLAVDRHRPFSEGNGLPARPGSMPNRMTAPGPDGRDRRRGRAQRRGRRGLLRRPRGIAPRAGRGEHQQRGQQRCRERPPPPHDHKIRGSRWP